MDIKASENRHHKFLDPVALSKLGGLELVARLVVEGFISGLHRSPYQGYSVEFAEHRQYMPGDEIKHIDWKVYAKSERFYIKKFEEETNLKAYILLDTSGSMGYKSGGISKLDYGCYLAASLTYLMLRQRDYVGLALFDGSIGRYIPPRGDPSHLHLITTALEEVSPGGETGVSEAIQELARRIIRRGLIILISDLLDDPQKVIRGLKLLRHSKHEVIVLHVMDQAELTFPFDGSVIFRDLETGDTLNTDANSLRSEYLRQVDEFLKAYKDGCGASSVDYVLMDTSTPFDYALSAYLSRRRLK
jgi:uncharacterized protein (DUF58 family)